MKTEMKAPRRALTLLKDPRTWWPQGAARALFPNPRTSWPRSAARALVPNPRTSWPRGAARALVIASLIAAASAATGDVVEGNITSPVKVTIYEDLQCSYCQTLRTMLDEKLLPKYGKTVAFVHHDLPLSKHVWARQAAMVGRWIYEQSPRKTFVYRREILDEQEHITPANLKPWLREFARRNELSEQGIIDAMTDSRMGLLVDQDVQLATARGITRIPAVYVAGKSFVEIIIYDDLAKTLDETLAR